MNGTVSGKEKRKLVSGGYMSGYRLPNGFSSEVAMLHFEGLIGANRLRYRSHQIRPDAHEFRTPTNLSRTFGCT